MKEAKGAALDIFMFWLSLIEMSSLMTPHKTDPYGIDSVWALWKLYLNIWGQKSGRALSFKEAGWERWEST